MNKNEKIVSRSIDLIEGHWECIKHSAMLSCLCKALLREEVVTYLQNGETCKIKCLPRKLMNTSWKPLGRCQ